MQAVVQMAFCGYRNTEQSLFILSPDNVFCGLLAAVRKLHFIQRKKAIPSSSYSRYSVARQTTSYHDASKALNRVSAFVRFFGRFRILPDDLKHTRCHNLLSPTGCFFKSIELYLIINGNYWK